MPQRPKVLIQPGKYYHIYNRGVNRRTIFHDEADFSRFLFYLEKYMANAGQTFAYALMDDHFHLLISTYPEANLPVFIKKNKKVLGRTFGHLQNAYAKYFNYKYNAVSALFERSFERKEVDNPDYFNTLVLYLHRNAVKHDLAEDMYAYPWTSLHQLSNHFKDSFLSREVVWAKFGGFQAFITAHEKLDAQLLGYDYEFEEDL